MKERSERALRQVEYLKADLYYNLLSCLAVFFFLPFGGSIGFFFLPGMDKRGTLEMRLHKAETQSRLCKAYSAMLTCDPLHLIAHATAWPAIRKENPKQLYLRMLFWKLISHSQRITLAKSLAV